MTQNDLKKIIQEEIGEVEKESNQFYNMRKLADETIVKIYKLLHSEQSLDSRAYIAKYFLQALVSKLKAKGLIAKNDTSVDFKNS